MCILETIVASESANHGFSIGRSGWRRWSTVRFHRFRNVGRVAANHEQWVPINTATAQRCTKHNGKPQWHNSINKYYNCTTVTNGIIIFIRSNNLRHEINIEITMWAGQRGKITCSLTRLRNIYKICRNLVCTVVVHIMLLWYACALCDVVPL